MNTMFESINKSRFNPESSTRSSGFNIGLTHQTEYENSDAITHKQEREFLYLITERLTKKMFLTKQKLKFLREVVLKKKGKVIYEGTEVDNLLSLDRKIELYQEILRHIRERNQFTECISNNLEVCLKMIQKQLNKKMKTLKIVKEDLNKRSPCKDIIEQIIKDELVIIPFKKARQERAIEAVTKKKDYYSKMYRSSLSRSVKTSNANWTNSKRKSNIVENEMRSSMYLNDQKAYLLNTSNDNQSQNQTQVKFRDLKTNQSKI